MTQEPRHQLDVEWLHANQKPRCALCKLPFPCQEAREAALEAAKARRGQ